MQAVAFSNNDMAIVAWTYDRHLPECLGFAVFRIDATGEPKALPAMARFEATKDLQHQDTTQAPIQKFWWKDLFVPRGSTVSYRIVPMTGAPGNLVPMEDIAPLESNKVTIGPARGIFKAYFNRGIVATQALTRKLEGKADVNKLKKRIKDPADEIRSGLQGQLYEGVTSLLDRADAEGGTILAALYELSDPEGLEKRLQAADRGKPASRTVILGNERSRLDDGTVVEDVDAEARAALHKSGVQVLDRMLDAGSIPHNKFLVYCNDDGPAALLTGSTNWTSSGLCTQTNNALVIESPRAAKVYADFWNRLREDLDASGGDNSELQGAKLRTDNREANLAMAEAPLVLEDGTRIEIHASPSTRALLKSPPKETPVDMARLFELVGNAKQAVLFLAFDPGNNSILDAAGQALARNPKLFVRGALTSTVRATNFKEALDKQREATGRGADLGVAVVGEPGGTAKPKKDAKPQPDYRAIPAGNINASDAFGAWEAEIYKAGFAIIHNKVVVIDPFSDDPIVITGSHNLGFRASHNNDENMVIIHGHRGLAEAYACHVLDIYDHYAFRYWLRKYPDTFGRPLDDTPKWQDRYIDGAEEKSAELRFWLAAQSSQT